MFKVDEIKRSVINYWQLNAVIIKDLTLISQIQDLIDHTKEAKYYSKMNLLKAFHQILIKKRDKGKIVFWIFFETFKYLIMPFKLMNASATFQRHITQILSFILEKGVLIYLNDILIVFLIKKENI